jgi:cytoskeleton-associated protein 5
MLQIFKVRHLAQAMKEGTLEKLVTQILIWISSETVLKTELDDARELLKALNDLMLHILVCELNISMICLFDGSPYVNFGIFEQDNVDRTSIFVILINLLFPFDPSRRPSYTPLELLAVTNAKILDLVVKCLVKLTKVCGFHFFPCRSCLVIPNTHGFDGIGKNS